MHGKNISRLFAIWLPTQEQASAKGGWWRPLSLGGLVMALLLGVPAAGLRAQELVSAPLSNLQDAPGSVAQGPGSEAVQPQASASIAGTVRDSKGAAIPGVEVTLAGQNPAGQNKAINCVATADKNGAFTFGGLAPGTYQVKLKEAGVALPAPAEVVLGAGEKRQLSLVATRIPTQTTRVRVVATSHQVAQAQVHEEEKQRVLGFLPNYYTSYIWNAAPLTPKQKFHLSLRQTTDPVTFLVAAGLAGVEQKHNTFPGYGQGTEGYAKRFGAAYGDTMISRMVSRAILPTVLHQDPRYFYRGSGSFRSRLFYALAQAFVCRGDDGRLEPNYSQMFGNFSAAGLSNVYRAPADRRVGLTLRNGLIITASGEVENVLREFLSRKLTPNVPVFANGKP